MSQRIQKLVHDFRLFAEVTIEKVTDEAELKEALDDLEIEFYLKIKKLVNEKNNKAGIR